MLGQVRLDLCATLGKIFAEFWIHASDPEVILPIALYREAQLLQLGREFGAVDGASGHLVPGIELDRAYRAVRPHGHIGDGDMGMPLRIPFARRAVLVLCRQNLGDRLLAVAAVAAGEGVLLEIIEAGLGRTLLRAIDCRMDICIARSE